LHENLYLGSRNLQGVELVLSSEVHPYDLLKYEHAIFSKAAFETLTETLKKAVSKRNHVEVEEPVETVAPVKAKAKTKTTKEAA
jgi:large subunit ribosomal protein L4